MQEIVKKFSKYGIFDTYFRRVRKAEQNKNRWFNPNWTEYMPMVVL